MSILAKCSTCGKKYRLGSERQGARFKCRDCGTTIRVPNQQSADPWDELDYDDSPEDEPLARPSRARKRKRKRKRGKKKSGSNAAIAITLSVFGVLLGIGVIGTIIWIASQRSDSQPGEDSGIAADNDSQQQKDGRKAAVAGNPNRSFPSIPHAVTSLPPAIADGAPFDVGEYFRVPEESENAAKLYFDAMFEFSPDLKDCFPPEDVKRRLQLAKERQKRFYAIWPSNSKRPTNADVAQVDRLLAELKTGFSKLDEAQKRSKCVFEPGMGIAPLTPHIFAARNINRVLHLKIREDLGRGDLDEAIGHLAIALRLARDIRPRGEIVTQLASFVMNKAICTEMLPRILVDSRLTLKQCDRLLGLFNTHAQTLPNAIDIGFKTEQLRLRKILYELEHKSGEFTRERILEGAAGEKITPTPGAIFSLIVTFDWDEQRERYDRMISQMTAEDYRQLREAVDQNFAQMYDALNEPRYHTSLDKLSRAAGRMTDKSQLLNVLISGYDKFYETATIDRTHVDGALCLIAIKRWILRKRGPLHDLAAVCKESGMSQVPVDPFDPSRRPLRFTRRSPYGSIAVYSVGPNFTDERGAIDWYGNRIRGDILIPLRRPSW